MLMSPGRAQPITPNSKPRGAPRPIAMADYGRRLFRTVFAEKIAFLYRRSLNLAHDQEKGLRIRLHLAEVPELLDIPWELLYDDAREEFLASSNGTPLVRYLDLPQPVEALRVDGPLRILVVVSSPKGLPSLDGPAEVGLLRAALDELVVADRVDLDPLETASLPALVAKLQQEGHHVLHYIGHGGFDEARQQGIIALEDDDGSYAPALAEDVAEVLAEIDSLRLVVMNSCEGARGSVVDPFAGVAQALVGTGVPTVVAMQFEVTDEAAVGFASGFYTGVADEASVDEAVRDSRLSMMTLGDGTEWVTPVLYSHADDTHLFTFASRPTVPAPSRGIDALPGAGRVVTPTLTVQVNPTTGILLDAPAGEVVPRARPVPVAVLPPPFPLLLGRDSEIAAAAEIGPGKMLQFVADAGWGKTALLRTVANREVGATPTGLLYLRCLTRPVLDVVQFLFESLFSTDIPFEASEEHAARWLDAADAIVVLDDVALGSAELATLRRVAPRCRFVMGTTTPNDDGPAVTLAGLPEEACVRLVELELGRRLSEAERSDAARLSELLGGKPARILAEMERAWEQDMPLTDLVRGLADAQATSYAIDPDRIRSLPDPGRGVLGVLAAMDPSPVHATHLIDVVGLTDPVPVFESLQRRGLIRAQSPEYSLSFPPSEDIRAAVDEEQWASMTVDHLTEWAQERATPTEVIRDSDVLLTAMRVGQGASRTQDVILLGRAIEGPLVAGRRWGQWGAVLSFELEAATLEANVGAQGWVHHQLGSRAAGLGDLRTARYELRRASELRRSTGDSVEAEATDHNLTVIRGGGGGIRPFRGFLAAFVVVAVVGFSLWAVIAHGAKPARSVAPHSLDLGSVPIESRSALGVTITNTGGGELTVTRVSVKPSDGPFQARSKCERPLGGGESCTVTVIFRPTATGPANAILLVEDDSDAAVARVKLSGIGVDKPVPAVVFEPSAVDFGSTTLGTTSSQTVTVKNSGTAHLDVRDAIAEEPFRVAASDCQPRVRPSSTCTIEVAFTPTDRGTATGKLVVKDNAGDHVVLLNGVGVTDRPDLILEDLVVGDPMQVDGGVEIPLAFAVRNDGDVSAGIFRVTVGPTQSSLDLVGPSFFFVFDASDEFTPDGLTTQELGPDDTVTFTGLLEFADRLQGKTVPISVIADRCFDDASLPRDCRVSETNEDNNRLDIQVFVPTFSTEPTSAAPVS